MKFNPLTIFIFFIILGIFGVTFAQKATVKVFLEMNRQIIQSIGGNYCQANIQKMKIRQFEN